MREDSSICFLLREKPGFPFSGEGPGSAASTGSSTVPRVLVVDDERVIADSVAAILNQSGFLAHAFYGGREAIDAAENLCPDIVLSDVLMPRVNGVEAAIAIKRVCPDTRIVLFSGQAATAEILTEARRQGHDFELLPKPIHPLQLLRRLREQSGPKS